MPDWMPKRQMTLGLDLQGGSHILLQIDRQDLANERLETTRDDIRTLLRDARIGYTGLTGSGNSVQVRIRDADGADWPPIVVALPLAGSYAIPVGQP